MLIVAELAGHLKHRAPADVAGRADGHDEFAVQAAADLHDGVPGQTLDEALVNYHRHKAGGLQLG